MWLYVDSHSFNDEPIFAILTKKNVVRFIITIIAIRRKNHYLKITITIYILRLINHNTMTTSFAIIKEKDQTLANDAIFSLMSHLFK